MSRLMDIWFHGQDVTDLPSKGRREETISVKDRSTWGMQEDHSRINEAEAGWS